MPNKAINYAPSAPDALTARRLFWRYGAVRVMRFYKIVILILFSIPTIQVNAQQNSEAVWEQWYQLWNSSQNCASDDDCVLFKGVRCFNPCGARPVNPERVADLLALEKKYVAMGGISCPMIMCPSGVAKAACVEGTCTTLRSWSKSGGPE